MIAPKCLPRSLNIKQWHIQITRCLETRVSPRNFRNREVDTKPQGSEVPKVLKFHSQDFDDSRDESHSGDRFFNKVLPSETELRRKEKKRVVKSKVGLKYYNIIYNITIYIYIIKCIKCVESNKYSAIIISPRV